MAYFIVNVYAFFTNAALFDKNYSAHSLLSGSLGFGSFSRAYKLKRTDRI